jgi:hypothetical protein
MLKLLFSILLFAGSAHSQSLKLFVSLNPAGDFVAESTEVSGKAIENADGSVEATQIRIPVKSLSSGISLRDDHMINKYLEAEKNPEIILKIAKGKEGKGSAILVVKGKEGKVSGNYAKGKDKLKAAFKLKISDFGIQDISYKGIGVEDEVKVEVIVPLVKSTAVATPPVAMPATKKMSPPVKAPLKKLETSQPNPAAPKK